MRILKSTLLPIFLFVAGLTSLQAQTHQSVNASGGDASGSGGSASYSVGQVVFTTPVGANGSVAQGVQQPYEISIVVAMEETQDINLMATVFPNPANEFISLQISGRSTTGLSYQFYDVSARLIESKNIESSITKIDMSGLATATYFLKVLDKQKEIKTFKIIKNK
ncbi:MAG: T9SS type A sorting domain-containing protein [Bacteroidota bacterium]